MAVQKSSFLQVGHRREQGGVDKGGRKGNEKAKVSSDGSTHDGKGRRGGNISIERGLHYPVRVKLDLESVHSLPKQGQSLGAILFFALEGRGVGDPNTIDGQ